MKHIHIDFAPASLRRTLFHTPGRFAALVLPALILLTIAVTQVAHYHDEREQLAALNAAIAARATAPRPAARAAAAPAVPQAQAEAVNAAVRQLNLPWRDLVDAVRAATPAAVALLTLEPDANRSTLRITAETRNSDDMLAYVAALQEQGWFDSVILERHEVAEQEPNRPLRFQLSAQWGGQ